MPPIQPCLWFDTEAEEAAALYTSLFERSRITGITRYGEAGPRPAGMVMTVSFELDGRPFVALNGGPQFPFTEAISLSVVCDTQDEVDRYWAALTEGGEEGPCGWLKDRFGVSWQIDLRRLHELIEGDDRAKADRAVAAMLGMRKLDLAEIERAAAG